MGWFGDIAGGVLDAYTGGLGTTLLGMTSNAVAGAQSASQARAANKFSAAQAVLDRNWSGQQAQNQMNFQNQQGGITREFNAGQAQIDRDYQTNMSNTSYQRAVGDLGKAGLNPMLSIMHQGASTPSGASASTSTPSGAMGHSSAPRGAMGQTFAGVSNVMNAAQLGEIKSRIDLNSAQKAKTEIETTLLPGYQEAQKKLMGAQTLGTNSTSVESRQRVLNLQQDIRESRNRILTMQAGWEKTRAETALDNATTNLRGDEQGLVQAQTALERVKKILEDAKVPEAQQNASLYANHPWLKGTEKAVGAASNVIGTGAGLGAAVKFIMKGVK